MRVEDFVIDLEETIGSKYALTNVQTWYEYVDGIRTDTILGYRYTITLLDRGYDTLSVKIAGKKQLDKPAKGNCPLVEFDGLQIFPTWRPNGHQVGASATAIHIVQS